MEMQNKIRQLVTILIATLLVTSIASTIVLSASAHTPAWDVITTAHVAAAPINIGVGQRLMIYAWLDKIFDGAQPSGSATANLYRFHNYTLVITKPDGTTDKIYQDRIEDTTSNQMFTYTPTQVGTYNVQFIFPGMKYNTGTAGVDYNANSAYVNDTYRASTAYTTFTVQEASIPNIIDSYPLPSEYWTRPIYGENPIWFQVASNWLGVQAAGYGGFANTFNTGGNGQMFGPVDAAGPLTGHIMWTKPLQSGGVVGSGTGLSVLGDTYFEGSAYIQRYQNPIVVNGRIYYSEPMSFTSGSGYAETCVDLRTGEEIWSILGMPQPAFAYIYDVQDYNQHGVYNAILFTSNFARAFDADTGNPLFNVTGVPSATAFQKVRGPSGEEIRYVMINAAATGQPADWRLCQWNSSRLWSFTGNTPSISAVTDGSTPNRYDWNISIPWRNTMTAAPTVECTIYNDIMLLQNGSLPSNAPSAFMGTLGFSPYSYMAINLNPAKGAVGSILWTKTFDPPAGNLTVLLAGVDPVNRIFTENLRETSQFKGYDLNTGNYLWTTKGQEPLDYYGSPASGSISNTFAYGNMYSSAYGGVVYCYDTKTGQVEWTYGNGGEGNSTDSGLEVPGPYPTFINAIGNDVVYLVTSEHTIETPLFKGALARAINATTGQEIWTVNSYTGEFSGNSYAIADGYATWFNGLDNQIYSVGRGPSALTLSAPQTGIIQGNSLIISGTVMDVSAGTKQNEQASRFANGVPVASDKCMKDWMGYVYQQKPQPTSFTGVGVTLSVIDANGNYRVIGTATTDIYGKYSLQWTPDIAGKFEVYATFAGTNGYWPSSSSTAFAVDAAPATATPQPTQAPTAADLYFIPAIAGLFVAIVVVIALIVLVLRKHP
jgi:hypothetical protein